ncbi:Putative competence-damage inducible protein (fragment) [Staphylococcus capitis]
MTPNNKQQALVIDGCKVLPNKTGMAPGMLIEKNDKKVVLLPGPPSEMKPMAKNELLPYLLDDDSVIFSELLRFAGIGESKVETILMDLIENQTNPTIAPLAGTHEVYIRITANSDSKNDCKNLIAPVKREILDRIGDYYYGSDDITLEEAVMSKINETFAIYDGVTNGALYTRLKNVDQNNVLNGLLPHNDLFIDITDRIHDQLFNAAQYVKDLYQTDLGIVLLHENEDVYLAMYDGEVLNVDTFKMTQSRNLLRSRSQNYAMIKLLKWFENQ